MRILNADDKAENLYLVEALFRGHGHEVVSVRNGEEALAAAGTTPFDVIVSDLLMPRMDGFQLIREIRSRSEYDHIPILVYTATYTDSKDEALARSLGADEFLLKPAETEDLVSAVEQAVRGRAERARVPAPQAAPPAEEVVVLKEYNARLIAKLEKKMLDLDAANRALKEDIERRERAETERQRLEQQLRNAHKMEAIGTLAGGIAHDFNNILTGVMCAAELGQSEPGLPETARKYFGEILSASARARDLVKQILTFSRRQQVERRPLNLAEPVGEAVRFIRSTIPSVVEIQSDLPKNLPGVLVDPTQIHQIITNLCTNAWHALGDREAARITIRLEVFPVSPELASAKPELRPMNYVRLTVADNGCGMDAPTQARIFDPFFTTKPPGVGTGLGLSVVHGIMRSYDGAILVESEPGEGSRFHLYFPALEMASSLRTVPDGETPRGQGQRILFLDDEALLANLGARLLCHLGYAPIAFTDPMKALDAFRAQGADVLVVDFSMPGLNGIEFAKRVLALRPDAVLILMTGFSAVLESQACTQYFKNVLLKPYTLNSLGRILRQTIGV